MAALYGKRFVHIHIPKTGGKWVRRALAAAGHPFRRDLSDAHAPAPALNNPDWVSFCFVRHPASWLASWYAYCQRYGWVDRDRPAKNLDPAKVYDRMLLETSAVRHDRGFESWVGEIERFYPGFVGAFFAPYIGSANIVGKQEALAADLAGIVGRIPDLDPFNVGENVPEITARVRRIVAAYEPLEALGYRRDS